MNEMPLIEQGQFDAEAIAKMFTAMSDQIKLNNSGAFGGAFVIVPPANGGHPIEVLILDNRQDVVQFWTFLKTKATITLEELNNAGKNQAFGRR